MPNLNGPYFTSRVPVQFISDDKPSLSITGSNSLFNNPNVFVVNAGVVAKPIPMVDGTYRITGTTEYAPVGLQIEWTQIGYTDYLALCQLINLYVTFISFRNVGYYGVITSVGPGSSKPYTSDIVSCKLNFLVLGPSDDGGAVACNRLATPTSLSGTTASGLGFIGGTTDTSYFLTYHTKWGETDYQHIHVESGSGAGASWANTLSWNWPSSNFCTYASLYCGPNSDPTQSQLMAEILSTMPATWTDVVGVNGISPPGSSFYKTPPASGVNNAFTGQFKGGVWFNAG